MVTAIIVVDVQNDFCEGGSLAVEGGSAIAASVSEYLAMSPHDVAVATADHHVDPGTHFAPDPDFIDTWPVHCVAGTAGADFHPALDLSQIDAVFLKGSFAAAYSGFEGMCDGVALDEWLRARHVASVEVVGLATDHCVRATALDARRLGYDTVVRLDLTAGVASATVRAALVDMQRAGVFVR